MVKPKKSLGQHFLVDKNITRKIANSIKNKNRLLEIGPGEGALTDFFINDENIDFKAIETDSESVEFLTKKYPDKKEKIIYGDFLKFDLSNFFNTNFSVIGNFPYNISSQIFFKIIDNRNQVDEVVCMIQKEVAERIAADKGNKSYGILSVLLQAYYNIEYLFTVSEKVFNPPPKVKSAVIRLTRNNTKHLQCNEKLFKEIIKKAFNQRRKMLRVSLKQYLKNIETEKYDIFTKRPEQLSINDFVYLTDLIEKNTD